jgi:glutathione S-transferase
VADSTFIRAHVERKYDLDLDEGLGPVERAHAWAIERMLENYLSWVSSYYRWLMPENFEKGPAHFFDGAPEEVRESLREDVRARVADRIFGVGITRHTPEEILELGDRSLLALSEMLGDKPYFGGERPVGVDATAFAILAGIMTPFFDSPIRQRAIGYRNLTAYVDRMMLQYFPQHDWASSRLASAANAEEVN